MMNAPYSHKSTTEQQQKISAQEYTESAVFRTLSNDVDCKIHHHGYQMEMLDDHSVQLSMISGSVNYAEWCDRRALIDRAAIWKRCHNETLHRNLRPSGDVSGQMFDALETARALSWKKDTYKGLQQNISEVLEQDYAPQVMLFQGQEKSEGLLPLVVGMILRERMTGEPPPPSLEKSCKAWREEIEAFIGGDLDQLVALMENQKTFAAFAKQTIEHLRQALQKDTALPEQQNEPDTDDHTQDDDSIEAEGEGKDQEQDADEKLNAQMMDAQGEDSDDGEQGEDPAEAENDLNDLSSDDSKPGEAPSRDDAEELLAQIGSDYKIFTKQHDEIKSIQELVTAEEQIALQADLNNYTESLSPLIVRTANRLQRYLMAQQERSWLFDLDDGTLDTARISRIIVDPLTTARYKVEKFSEFRDSVITLLIDNSGSMRGRPITVAAVVADILTKTLERCGVKVEVLGFTTSTWKGGKPRENWLSQGKPKQPGRLNSLLHIIYKHADSPYRRQKNAFAGMLKEGLLKENIDGEALLWAYARLMRRPEQRRILITISDGAPVDDASLSANNSQYLDAHLRQVIQFIERAQKVELLAIGIGHDVTRYYQNATTIHDVQHLGEVMTSKLMTLFRPKKNFAQKKF